MISNKTMRDAFWDRLYEFAKDDKKVILVCADMGAPALDKWRKDLTNQYFNVGIAEHNMLGIASGLAKEGKNVYTYAIAPFITSRAHEFAKLNGGLMKLPIKIVGVGAGFSYDDSGPTHHTTEDISIMRAIPNLVVLSPSDSIIAEKFAEISYCSKEPIYLRLDRQIQPNIYNINNKADYYKKGFCEISPGENTAIVSTGNMVHTALNVRKELLSKGKNIGVIDLYRLSPINNEFKEVLKNYKNIVSLEEHVLNGGLGSIISETITDNEIKVNLKRIGLTDYIYCYGGRENIQKVCGIDKNSVIKTINSL